MLSFHFSFALMKEFWVRQLGLEPKADQKASCNQTYGQKKIYELILVILILNLHTILYYISKANVPMSLKSSHLLLINQISDCVTEPCVCVGAAVLAKTTMG